MTTTDEDVRDGRGERTQHSYYRLPLTDDAERTVTVFRLGTQPRAVVLELWDALDQDRLTPEQRRGPGRYRVSGLRETLTMPGPGATVLTPQEAVLAEVAAFLLTVDLGEGGVYPWYFAGALSHDAWLLHLRQLCALHARLAPARESEVHDDHRVVHRVNEIALTCRPHADTLRAWLRQARADRPAATRRFAHALREARVDKVLDELGPVEENVRSRPNPGLPRLGGPDQEQAHPGPPDD